MERGLTLPGLAMLVRLADALQCNVTDLVRVLDRRPRAKANPRKTPKSR
jgi:hypothetical protein